MQDLVAIILEDLVAMKNLPNVIRWDILPILHHMMNHFTVLCLNEHTRCSGIKLMTKTLHQAYRWIGEHEGKLVQTLLYIFKDLPLDVPCNIDNTIDILLDVLCIGNSHIDFTGEGMPSAHNKLINLMGIFFPEIQNSHPIVHQASQKCITYLVSLSGWPTVEWLLPYCDHMLSSVYTKPLCALPFSKQIGMIEAIHYCVSLKPPLVQLNKELLRLLHETLALADTDDIHLLGQESVHQGTIKITKLCVACIRLLTAAMPITDLFSCQTQTR